MCQPRRIPAWVICLALAVLPLSVHAALPESVGGRVYLDANGNGQRDPDEKPLAGIRVTDGVNIVLTGPDGSYSITIAPDPTTPQMGSRVVAVSWPDGTWPSGTWWARMDQIADASAVNFGLREEQQSLPFAFLHLSDDHGAGGQYKRIARAAGRLRPLLRFCINTGDSAGHDVAMGHLQTNAANFVVPVMCVPGNHDIVNWGPARLEQTPLAGNGGFTKRMGPVRWSFDYAGTHFVGLDWMDPSIPEEINGSVPEVAADWLEKDLQAVKPGARIFVFVHFPTGCQKYYDLIAKYKVAYVFGGHNHTHRFYDFAGIPAVTAINFMAGGNLIIVQDNDFAVCEFCLGYKGPDHHIKRCSLDRIGSTLNAVKAREMAVQTLAAQPLSGGTAPLKLDAKGVRIALEMAPGTAAKAGIRIAATPRPIDIVWTGTELDVAGVPLPFGWEDYDRSTLLWDVVFDGERIEFYANKRYHMGKAFKVDGVTGVTVFAEGGEAMLKKTMVWGLSGG